MRKRNMSEEEGERGEEIEMDDDDASVDDEIDVGTNETEEQSSTQYSHNSNNNYNAVAGIQNDHHFGNNFAIPQSTLSQMSEADRKRAHHNALERKRRDHIKDSFHTLRDAIPNIRGEKTSRAQILKAATEYIKTMRNRNNDYQKDIDLLKKQNTDIEYQIRQLEKAKATNQFARQSAAATTTTTSTSSIDNNNHYSQHHNDQQQSSNAKLIQTNNNTVVITSLSPSSSSDINDNNQFLKPKRLKQQQLN